MKKILTILAVMFLIFSNLPGLFFPVASAATSGPRLVINGQVTDPFVPLRFVDDRTLMPVIQFQKSMGMTVEWDGVNNRVTIKDRGRVVVMTINSKTAYVNGVQKTLEVAPVIIEDRTYLPLRALGDLLGLVVAWEAATDTIIVNRPLSLNVDGKNIPVTMNKLPDGHFVDLYSIYKGLGITYALNNGILTLTKGNVHEDLPRLSGIDGFGGFRVIDGHSGIPLGTIMKLINGIGQWQGETFMMTTQQSTVQQPPTSVKPFTVVIDPGHGGIDSGCIGSDGKSLEKDFTLSVANKLMGRVNGNGNFKGLMTRTNDTLPTLDERVNFANNAGADVFISIHANASTTPTPSGTESYYYNPISQPFAQDIHKHLMEATGFTDRGIRVNNFRVITNTKMPAVLVEVGFYTNPDNLQYMNSDTFREKVADELYQAIVEYYSQTKLQ